VLPVYKKGFERCLLKFAVNFAHARFEAMPFGFASGLFEDRECHQFALFAGFETFGLDCGQTGRTLGASNAASLELLDLGASVRKYPSLGRDVGKRHELLRTNHKKILTSA
jgi:hypothetical protein